MCLRACGCGWVQVGGCACNSFGMHPAAAAAADDELANGFA